MGGTKRRVVHVAAALLAVALLAACEPPRPSVGRGTPVRRVFLLGDSITHGLYGTTPRIHGLLDQRLRQRGIQLSIGGFPGENPLWVWPGHPSWLEVLRERVRNFDPDMIIIQSTLFPEVGDPAKHDLYLRTVRQMLDVAQSRGAHVYFVHHRPPPASHPKERIALAVIEQLQGQAGAGRGVSWIPLETWLANCSNPVSADGWHLSHNGQVCHASAITVAVDQLRRQNG